MNTAASAPSVTSKVIGPQEAAAMLASYKYEHQRKPAASWSKYLADEMRAGTFDQSTTIRIARLGASGYVIDGQHRLMAVIESGIPQRFVIVETKASNESQIADMYTRIDQAKRRTPSEKFRTLMLADELGLYNEDIDRIGAAVKLIWNRWANKNAKSVIHQDDHVRLIREYADAYAEYKDASTLEGGVASKNMRVAVKRAATVSVAIVTFRYSKLEYGEKVDAFWDGVIRDDGIAATDPRKFANRHLLETSIVGGMSSGKRESVSTFYSARILAACFNDFMKDRKRKMMPKVFDQIAPMLILGSPFDGK